MYRLKFFLGMLLLGFLMTSSWPLFAGENLTPTIRIKGSDTLAKALKELSLAYQKLTPRLRVEVIGGGSGNGIAALINKHVDIASSSRPLRSREVFLISKKYSGVLPVAHEVAFDAVTIVVHPGNPINGVSLQQLTDIYGKSDHTPRWTDLGVTVPNCPDQKIQPLSRKNNSGTYVFFKQAILNKNNHFDSQAIQNMDATDLLVDQVAQTPCAIGYAGMAFVTGNVKTLCISKGNTAKSPCVPPTAASTLDKTYPLSRTLYLFTLGEPQGEINKLLEWIKGPDAQEILLRTGYVPLKSPKH